MKKKEYLVIVFLIYIFLLLYYIMQHFFNLKTTLTFKQRLRMTTQSIRKQLTLTIIHIHGC